MTLMMPSSNKHLTTPSPPLSAAVSDLKRRVLQSLSKLSDRDTLPQAAAELEITAVTLNHHTISSFISWIKPPEPSKSAVRATSLRLLSVLSRHHGGALVHVLPKMVAAVTCRLRDGDTASRAACVEAISAMAANIEAPLSAFLNPIAAVLFSDQDAGAQAGAAQCLAAAVDGVTFRDPPSLRRLFLKLLKLLNCNGFRAKAALLALIGSVIEGGGSSSSSAVKAAVRRMMNCVSSSEWSTRKAAAGALAKLAVAERDLLPEFKASCLKILEDRRYDKVKAVREAMTDLVDKWKEIPDVSYDTSPPPLSHSSCREAVNDNGCISCIDSNSKWHSNSRRFSMPSESISAMCKERDDVEHSRMSREVKTVRRTPVFHTPGIANRGESDDHPGSRLGQAVFIRTSESYIPLSHEEIPESVESYNGPGKQADDLASITKQLVHIERQQSCLLELLQKFIGSSECGMGTLERRVYGLELMLEKVLFDFSVTRGGQVSEEEVPPTCCVLPGFSSRFLTKVSGGRNVPSSPGSSGPLQANGDLKHKGCSPGKLVVNPLA